MGKNFFVYIITNDFHTVLYVGVTSDLPKRIMQHKNKTFEGFSSKYNTSKLVYFEQASDAENAIMREKQIKNWRREKKDCLISDTNPKWDDLYHSLF